MPSASIVATIVAAGLAQAFPTVTSLFAASANAATGRIFYVNAAASNDTNALNGGSDWLTPLSSLSGTNGAISNCTAARGDIIVCGPGHTEALTAAAAIAMSKSGVTVIGVGSGRLRPTFTWSTDTAATMTITGANCKFVNCVFDFTGIDAVVAAIKVDAADVVFQDCEFITNSGTTGVV